MSKSLIVLSSSIFLSSLIICSTWIYVERIVNRYEAVSNATGAQVLILDKLSGKVYYKGNVVGHPKY
jgi:hypothetical protein